MEKVQVVALDDANGTIIDIGPRYVKADAESGWQQCNADEAMAISVRGKLYDIAGAEAADDRPVGDWARTDPDDPESSAQTVFVYEAERDSLTVQMLKTVATHGSELTESQLALADVYEGQVSLAEQITEIQMAMAEQYENGGID